MRLLTTRYIMIDRLDMTLAVDRVVKPQYKQTNIMIVLH